MQSLKENKKSALVINFKKIMHQSVIQFLAKNNKESYLWIMHFCTYEDQAYAGHISVTFIFIVLLIVSQCTICLIKKLPWNYFISLPFNTKSKANKPIIQVSSLSTTLFILERTVICNISFLNCHQNNAKGSNLCLQYRTVFFYCMPSR